MSHRWPSTATGGVGDGEFWVPYSVEGGDVDDGTNVVVSDRSLTVDHRFDFA